MNILKNYYSIFDIDNKFELYKGKIQDMFANEEFTKLLNEKNEALKQIEMSQNNFKNNNNSKSPKIIDKIKMAGIPITSNDFKLNIFS